MAKFILGILIGAGIAFTVLALIEKEQQKAIRAYRELKERQR